MNVDEIDQTMDLKLEQLDYFKRKLETIEKVLGDCGQYEAATEVGTVLGICKSVERLMHEIVALNCTNLTQPAEPESPEQTEDLS